MPLSTEELERILETQENKNEKEFKEVKEGIEEIKSLLGKGIKLPTESGQSPSSQQPESSTAPSNSEESEEKKWENFFNEKGVTDQDQKTLWKNTSGLTLDDVQTVWKNGWRDLTEKGGITKLIDKHATYTTKESKKETTEGVDLLKHKKEDLDAIHRFIFDMSNAERLYSDKEIQEVLKNIKVPESKNYDALIEIRNTRTKELFKKGFESNGKTHGLSNDEKIDEWRTADTGLSKNGIDERKVFDNGWVDKLAEITDKQLPVYSYNKKETKNVDVLKVNKEELNKVHDILVEISAKKTFFELPVNYEGEEHKIADLKYNQLPDDTKQVIKKAIEDQRNTFTYRVDVEDNEKKGDGLNPQLLVDAVKEIEENKKEPQKYKPLTAKILNDFLNASDLKISEVDGKGEPILDKQKKPKTNPVKIKGDTVEDLDAPNEELYGKDKDGKPRSWLEFQGAFKLPKELTDVEDHLDLKIKGSELLPDFYKKNNYDPENPTYCKFTGEGDKKDIPTHPKKLENGDPNPKGGAPIDESGYLAIATGVGKTTKTINCLVNGGERNVILVCPNAGLCSSAAKHHEGWLQTWGCVVHKKPLMKDGQPVMEDVEDPITKEIKPAPRYESHGTYPVKLNDLVYYEKQDGSTEGNKGLSVLEPWALFIYLVRKLWSQKPKKKGEKSGMDIVLERIKSMKPDGKAKFKKNVVQKGKNGEKKIVEVEVDEFVPGKESYTRWVEEAVSKFIPKGTIIVFDEAHFTKAEYQILSKYVIFLTKDMGIEVMKMSATFKGIPFSSTSTFPRRNLYMSSIQPKFKLGDEEVDLDDLLSKSKVWIFIPNAEKELNDKQKEIMKGVSNVVFSQPFDDFCESISFGMPPSTSMLVDGSKEMGFTPDTDIVILLNIMESSNLQVNWEYTTSNFSWISLASFAQQIGRVGRIKNGLAITTSKELEEFVIKPEVSVYAIQMALGSTDETVLKKMKSAGFSDVEHLRGSIALANKENKKWGLSVAELIVGASAGTAGYPKWESAKATYRVDVNLWDKHMGTYESPKIEPEVAKDIMNVMIATYIKKPMPPADKEKSANRFPFELNVEMKSTLIKEYGLDPQDVKKVLNGVIEERRKEIEKERKERGNPNPDPVVFNANEEDLFHETVALLQLALKVKPGENITVGEEKDKEGKKFSVMRINYTAKELIKKKMISEIDMIKEEKFQFIRKSLYNILYKYDVQLYKGDVGKEVREALDKDTLEGYKNIIIKLRSPRLANVLIYYIGNSDAMKLVYKLQNLLQDAVEKDLAERKAELMKNIEAKVEILSIIKK